MTGPDQYRIAHGVENEHGNRPIAAFDTIEEAREFRKTATNPSLIGCFWDGRLEREHD